MPSFTKHRRKKNTKHGGSVRVRSGRCDYKIYVDRPQNYSPHKTKDGQYCFSSEKARDNYDTINATLNNATSDYKQKLATMLNYMYDTRRPDSKYSNFDELNEAYQEATRVDTSKVPPKPTSNPSNEVLNRVRAQHDTTTNIKESVNLRSKLIKITSRLRPNWLKNGKFREALGKFDENYMLDELKKNVR